MDKLKEMWLKELEEKGLEEIKGQWKFGERINNFLNSDDEILINPGGMGLGKTKVTGFILKQHQKNYDYVLISTPTAPIKKIWAKELGGLGLENQQVIWYAKDDCCIQKIIDPKFEVYKKSNCTDDCKFMKDLKKDKEYNIQLINYILSQLKFSETGFAKDYYKKFGKKYCLLAVIRWALNNKKYIIGDYYSFLNPSMFNNVVKERSSQDSILLIDEGHLLPNRAKDFLSKELNFSSIIKKLDNEIGSFGKNMILMSKWSNTIKILKEIEKELIKKGKEIKGTECRYTYNDFLEDYDKYHPKYPNAYKFELFLIYLRTIARGKELDEYNDKKELEIKIPTFFETWKEKQEDVRYSNYFQYMIYNTKSIKFFLNCQDPSEHIKKIFQRYKKIIIMSGTINKDYFSFNLGLKNFKTKFESHIDSYSLKEHTIIYPQGSFIGKNRLETYETYKKKLQTIISTFKGRTLIFIQKKEQAYIIQNQLKGIVPVVNLCETNGSENSRDIYLKKQKEFNNLKKGVGIMNILGRVEGSNFKNEIDDTSISNIIIYGYPYPKLGPIFNDELVYLTNKIKDEKIAKDWLNYSSVIGRIHQACSRAKRNEKDNPTIILWGLSFGTDVYKFLPTELKGEIIHEKYNSKPEISENIIQKIKNLQRKYGTI